VVLGCKIAVRRDEIDLHGIGSMHVELVLTCLPITSVCRLKKDMAGAYMIAIFHSFQAV
jgi:hypothetical protein